jgi:hypothetical protein
LLDLKRLIAEAVDTSGFKNKIAEIDSHKENVRRKAS